MRDLFKVGAKLLGLSNILVTIGYLSSLLSIRTEANPVFLVIFFSLISITFSLILIFKTDLVSNVVGGSVAGGSEPISARSLLKVGIILIGVSTFLNKIPHVFSLITFIMNNSTQVYPVRWKILADCLPLFLSPFLIFGSEKILEVLEKCGTRAS